MHNLDELQVYHKALSYTKIVRGITKSFPKDELFGLISQFKRAADSIALNIAEGACKIHQIKSLFISLIIVFDLLSNVKVVLILRSKINLLIKRIIRCCLQIQMNS